MKFPKRYAMVILTFLCTNIFYMERMGFPIAYSAAANAAGMVDQSSKGLILSTFYYGYAISQIPGGWAAQQLGGRRILLSSFLLWSLICALIPMNPSRVALLVISRLLVGAAQGLIFPSIHNILALWVPPHERSRSVSLTTSGMYLGAASAMLLLPRLVKLRGPQFIFLLEAALGLAWCALWLGFSADPPSSLPRSVKEKKPGGSIPWRSMILSLPVWAIVANNFTFHYALYVLMNWLPTYFELGLRISLHEMGSSAMLPYLNMFVFSNAGGVIADHLIGRMAISVARTRRILNTLGFVASALALFALPQAKTNAGAVLFSSAALGSLALGRAGFAVNHLDIAPAHAGIVMGISNTAGTLAGIIGVGLTGRILERARVSDPQLYGTEPWKTVFFVPGCLCIFSAVVFLLFSRGERLFH